MKTLLEQTRFVDFAALCSADTAADGLVRRPVNQPRYLCVLDFEATCDEGKGFSPAEIIEFPAIILDTRTMSEVDNFHRYCRPVERPVLTEFCKSLTGIMQEQVSGRPTFSCARVQLCSLAMSHVIQLECSFKGYASKEKCETQLKPQEQLTVSCMISTKKGCE